MAKSKKDDDVQKVRLEEVGPEAKAAHDASLKSSVFTREVFIAAFVAVTALATFGQMLMQYKVHELSTVAAVKVEEVAVTLVETTKINQDGMKDLKKTADETHILVNSNFSNQLRVSALALRQVADYARQFDKERYEKANAAATAAEKLLEEHELEQKKIDDKEKKGE